MTKEEKRLLLEEICSRSPYGVKVWRQGEDYVVSSIDIEKQRVYLKVDFEAVRGWWFDIEEVRPYLRPMESMTEEEKEEIAFIRDRDFQSVRKWVHDESIKETGNICPVSCGEIDYCNKKHLDYRWLIDEGLALEAPEGMYKTEQNMKLKLKYYDYPYLIIFPALLVGKHDVCLGWLKWGIVLSW